MMNDIGSLNPFDGTNWWLITYLSFVTVVYIIVLLAFLASLWTDDSAKAKKFFGHLVSITLAQGWLYMAGLWSLL